MSKPKSKVEIISARAKQIRRKGEAWTAAIRRATAALKAESKI